MIVRSQKENKKNAGQNWEGRHIMMEREGERETEEESQPAGAALICATKDISE